MNMLDMNSREKVNRIHLDEIHKEAKIRQMLREADQENALGSQRPQQRQNIFLMIKAFFAWPGALLHHLFSNSHSSHSLK